MKPYLEEKITAALKELNYPVKEITFDIPKEGKFGDLFTNIALTLSKELKQPPRRVAEEIVKNLQLAKNKISGIEIAGPGFINFFISDEFYKEVLLQVLDKKNNYGRSDYNKNKTANLEWVSANPTGPLHLGHGRQVCLGKSIANLLEWTGYDLTREYYYNDAGNQMSNFAKSVYARYMQLINPEFPFPEEGYAGDYIREIASLIFKEKGDSLKGSADLEFFKKTGENYVFKMIRQTLDKLGIHHNVFFNESDLYKKGEIEETLKDFASKGLSYEKEGAVWLKMGEGFEKDKVIVKSTGEPTYRLPDMAYHIDKIKRGYDLIIDIFGSDHGDTYKEVLFGVKAAGYDTGRIKVIIHQMVTFKMGNESFKMSKRSGKVYSLDDLIQDTGADAAQFFFVMRSPNTHLDFDIELAKEQSDKNPVYYLQYAHARIAGILRNADENLPEYKNVSINDLKLDILKSIDEINLLKILSRFPEEVADAASSFEPHRIITYLNEVASKFHVFYHNNRVVNPEDKDLSIVRLHLCLAAKQVLKNGFDIIGISAPERM